MHYLSTLSYPELMIVYNRSYELLEHTDKSSYAHTLLVRLFFRCGREQVMRTMGCGE